jgi:hypothetical protein
MSIIMFDDMQLMNCFYILKVYAAMVEIINYKNIQMAKVFVLDLSLNYNT